MQGSKNRRMSNEQNFDREALYANESCDEHAVYFRR